MPQNTLNVLILHDDEIGWSAVRAALDKRGDVGFSSEARSRGAVLLEARKRHIDLLLASDRLGGASSYSTLEELRATSCSTSLLALFVDRLAPTDLQRFGQLELSGCCRWDELNTAEAVNASLTAMLTGDLLVGTRKVARDYFYAAHGTTREARQAIQLDELDRQILLLLARGCTARDIARRVHRASRTVNNRLYQLRGRLGARNSPHLVHLAHRLCLIDPSDDGSRIRQ